MEMGSDDDKIVDVHELCETKYFYEHLRACEEKKMPAHNYMKKVQVQLAAGDIHPAALRAEQVDWFVDVVGRYKVPPETLYLATNYMDRYLSRTPIAGPSFNLLGAACIRIASKYEEGHVPRVEGLCDLDANRMYSKDEVLEMESSVLNLLKFEMTAPTAICFLRLISGVDDDNMAAARDDSRQLDQFYMASYVCELSLLNYSLLWYAPSLIAASAFFLARFILTPSQKPWNSYLTHYTRYQPSDLQDCVDGLHRLVSASPVFRKAGLSSIWTKYERCEYKSVANITWPASIPLEIFDNNISSSLDDGQIEEVAAEIMRQLMKVFESIDSALRKTLMRTVVGQVTIFVWYQHILYYRSTEHSFYRNAS